LALRPGQGQGQGQGLTSLQKHKNFKLLCIFHFILICPYGCHLIMLFLSFVYIWLPTKYWMSHHSLPEVKEPKHTSLAKTG